jgi:hypothetical protein
VSKPPSRLKIAGRWHVMILLKVETRDHGRPATAVVGHNDTTFRLEGGEEFITAWVPEETVKKQVTA